MAYQLNYRKEQYEATTAQLAKQKEVNDKKKELDQQKVNTDFYEGKEDTV